MTGGGGGAAADVQVPGELHTLLVHVMVLPSDDGVKPKEHVRDASEWPF